MLLTSSMRSLRQRLASPLVVALCGASARSNSLKPSMPLTRCLKPSMKPMTSTPSDSMASMMAAEMTPLIPGAGPPPTRRAKRPGDEAVNMCYAFHTRTGKGVLVQFSRSRGFDQRHLKRAGSAVAGLPNGLDADQLAQLHPDVVRAHQRFADEDGTDAAGRKALHVGTRADAAFADHAHAGREFRGNLQRVFQPRDECAQVAVVHTDQARAGVQHAPQVRPLVKLHERLEPQFVSLTPQARQRLAVEDLRDEQHGVGAGEARFQELIALADEVLAQQREIHGGADVAQVRQAALEERLRRDDGQAGSTVGGVGASDGDGVEVGAQDAGRRRRLLHFRDDTDAWPTLQCGAEIERTR